MAALITLKQSHNPQFSDPARARALAERATER
jgi:hypothetical protein